MRILGVSSYPVEAAGTRYRMQQFVEPLASKGIDLEISPFFDKKQFELLYQNKGLVRKGGRAAVSVLKRFSEILKIRQYDLLFVQREAMIFGPAVFEWIFQNYGKIPMILDLDDATYISYESPIYGKIGSWLKFFSKTDKLISRADAVICGNRFIAEYVEKKGTNTVVIPTIVDTDKFFPVKKENDAPVLGWIGTHSTFPLLKTIFPVLQELARKHDFILKIVGAGTDDIKIDGVKIENLKWTLEREIADFQSLDIGLYPLTAAGSVSKEWLMGKSGFKAIQYLAVGIPYVITPVGIGGEIGIEGQTHYSAVSGDEWYDKLDKLISDKNLREEMGENGRKFSLNNFSLDEQVKKLADTFFDAVRNRKLSVSAPKQVVLKR